MKADAKPEPRIVFVKRTIRPGSKLPRRPWIMPGLLLKGHVTELVATSGVGKSSLALAIACHLAAGKDFGRFRIKQRYRVAIVSVEEDDDEFDRRLSAIAVRYGFSEADIKGYLLTIHYRVADGGLCLARANHKGVVQPTPDLVELEARLFDEMIDVLCLDPLAELWQGSENDNSQLGAVLRLIRGMARRNEMAILLNHHTGKGTIEPGNIDAARGASSGPAAVRFLYTLSKASAEDATALGLNEDEARHLMRLDLAKGQYRASANDNDADFFRFHSVDLGNGNGEEPSDSVGVLFPQIRRAPEIGAVDKAEGVFLKLLQIHNSQHIDVSASPSSRSFAPKVFYDHPQNENVSLKALKAAMHALLKKGEIANAAYGPPSKAQYRLEVVKCNF